MIVVSAGIIVVVIIERWRLAARVPCWDVDNTHPPAECGM